MLRLRRVGSRRDELIPDVVVLDEPTLDELGVAPEESPGQPAPRLDDAAPVVVVAHDRRDSIDDHFSHRTESIVGVARGHAAMAAAPRTKPACADSSRAA